MFGKEKRDSEEVMKRLVGARLSSVQFVLDYLILGFEPNGALTTLVWPEIVNDGITWRFGLPGYRDQLCSLITNIVDAVEIDCEETITIIFRGEWLLVIRLQLCKRSGERAIFKAPGHILYVW